MIIRTRIKREWGCEQKSPISSYIVRDDDMYVI
eukprot:COSAG04_NODE_32783_length_196_cov_27.731959_1_plen_32_part_10